MDQREPLSPDPDAGLLLQPWPLPIALMRRDGTVLGASRAFEETYGVQALNSARLRALLEEHPAHWESADVKLRGGEWHAVSVYLIPFRDDTLVLFAEPGSPIEDTPKVAELEVRVTELERLVATDRLTGAWNRAHLDRIMAMEMSRSARYRQPLSVILLDIDHFKEVNDKHGHSAGDAVLRKMVQVVQHDIRPGDMLFRWGGEEFLVLVPSTPYHHAGVVAEKIRASVAAADFGAAGPVTVSIGVAERFSGESADALFERVDKALYAAKSGGRNRTVVDHGGCSDTWKTSVLRLEWSDEYASGNPVIDAEHRELFTLGNRLIDASLREAVSQREIKEALTLLLADVQRHFADEEAILEKMNYIRIVQHKRAHAALLKRAVQMRALADNGMLTFGTLVDFVAHDVVTKHLLTMDRQFFGLFRPDHEGWQAAGGGMQAQ